MKLINKINLRYLIFSSIILLFLGVGIHISLQLLLEEETDEKLVHISKVAIKHIEKEKKLSTLEPYISTHIISPKKDTSYFSNIVILDNDKEGEEFRQLNVVKNIEDKTYRIIIRESAVESDDLLEAIAVLILVSLSLLLIMLYLINRIISTSVWSTFYTNLEKLKHFSLTNLKPFTPEESDVLEFKELNNVIKTLTDKVIEDYEILKQFSEDASHELQTPLAVIRSKIESLLDGNQLNELQTEKIQAIYNSVNKLSRINKGLLLIAKIGNRQFNRLELLNISELVKEKVSYFTELAEIKSLKFNIKLISNWNLNSNKYLFDLLLNNLLYNAISHSHPKGDITILLEDKKMTISNSGEKPIENQDRMFERFSKGENSGSVGLGLAISKQICLAINLHLNYRFENGYHLFSVTEKL